MDNHSIPITKKIQNTKYKILKKKDHMGMHGHPLWVSGPLFFIFYIFLFRWFGLYLVLANNATYHESITLYN